MQAVSDSHTLDLKTYIHRPGGGGGGRRSLGKQEKSDAARGLLGGTNSAINQVVLGAVPFAAQTANTAKASVGAASIEQLASAKGGRSCDIPSHSWFSGQHACCYSAYDATTYGW